jgi:hypothetical protein
MRELSVIELDLIVGGYSQDDVFDQSSYESVAVEQTDGSYVVEGVSEEAYSAQAAGAQAAGWTIGGSVSTGPNGTTVTVTASHSS